jgi:fermentation-respiration switch protein FrsA (DUF1100 family)
MAPDVLGDGWLVRLLLVGLGGYASLVPVAWFGADRLIFLPPPATYEASPDLLALETADGGRIAAVHLPHPDARYTILVSHGNAEDLGMIEPYLRVLHGLGFGVLGYDYRGYGRSDGRPSEEATYRDIDAAWDYLVERARIPPARIILLGRSVGGGPSVDLAARRPVGGLVLESAFVSTFRVLTRVPLLPFDRFRNLDKIGRVRCPVLVMHGTEDTIVPAWHGRALYEAAPGPKRALWVEGAGHNDFMLVAGARYGRALRDFAALLDGGD